MIRKYFPKKGLGSFNFSKNWTKAILGDQNALLDLLYTFSSNMDTKLQDELTVHGVIEYRIESMKGLCIKN